MKILVVGSGGREHALCCSIKRSKKVDEIFCAPGNAGISSVAKCVPIKPMDFEAMASFAVKEKIDLTVIGMDDPLVGGIVDDKRLPRPGYQAFRALGDINTDI